MTTSLTRERPTGTTAATNDAGRQPMGRREELSFLVFATWTVAGLFLDGWAHQAGKPETFFTPWHAVLYSGFAAGVIWAGVEALRQGRPPLTSMAPSATAGSRLTAVGMACFAAGGIGDGIWHGIFGIEEDLETLLSPTHLLLMTGGLLLVTGPLRAAWVTSTDRSPTLWSFLPTLLGATLSAALLSFFLMFVGPFDGLRRVAFDDGEAYAIAGMLIFNLVWLAPLFHLARRWTLPFGAVTVHIGVVAVGMAGVEGFARLPLASGFVLAGFVGDILLSVAFRGHLDPANARRFGAAMALLLWLPHFGLRFALYDAWWTPELWAGTVFLNVLGAVGLALMSLPPAWPAPAEPAGGELPVALVRGEDAPAGEDVFRLV